MKIYKFDLIFKITENIDPSIYLDRLYESSCDDTLIFTGLKGFIGINFVREAQSAKEALTTALKNVTNTTLPIQLERAEPELLNLSELAFLFNFTKQNMRKYARGEVSLIKDRFPTPVISGKVSYWHAAEIAQWLHDQNVRKIDDQKLELLFSIWSLNQALELLRQPNKLMISSFTSLLKSVA